MTGGRFYEEPDSQSAIRSAPAVLRNCSPIGDMLADWLPESGTVLEIASGTGEHALAFATRFANLTWQPSDRDPLALASIAARQRGGPLNLCQPLTIDAELPDWPNASADAMLCINIDSCSCDEPKTPEKRGYSAVLCMNMVHISPWTAALGLLNGSAKVLKPGGALILYGPWLQAGVTTAPSNVAFDQSLKERDPAWGLRSVEDLEAEAVKRGFALEQVRHMPANNLMLLLRLLPVDAEAG